MTPKEQATMQQALEAFKEVNGLIDHYEYTSGLCYMATAALEEALAEQAEQEPVGHVLPDGTICWDKWCPDAGTLLYAAPVRTKDLTDDEVQKLWNDTSSIVPMWAHHLYFARAVIAADRSKNK